MGQWLFKPKDIENVTPPDSVRSSSRWTISNQSPYVTPDSTPTRLQQLALLNASAHRRIRERVAPLNANETPIDPVTDDESSKDITAPPSTNTQQNNWFIF